MVFVDIEGNIGHQCAGIKAAHPKLQDLPETIQAPPIEGVRFMALDFFTPQPVIGRFSSLNPYNTLCMAY
jgi:hypothetical protein